MRCAGLSSGRDRRGVPNSLTKSNGSFVGLASKIGQNGQRNMIKTGCKWVKRCLGWLILSGVALGALYAYYVHKTIGYGTLELQLTWNDKAYPLDRLAGGNPDLRVRGEPQAWASGPVLTLRPGPATLELRARHFQPCSIKTTVVKNTKVVAELRLQAEPHTISIQGLKTNAVVNGERCERTWVLRNAEVGRSYPVEATVPGFHTNSVNLRIENPGEDLVTNLVWIPLTAYVSLSVMPPANDLSVSIDGASQAPFASRLLEVGVHSLTVSHSDYYPYSQQVEVVFGVTNHCLVNLKPKPATLSIQVTPSVPYQVTDGAGGAILVQEGTAEVPPGTNRLILTARGFVPQQQDFAMAPNKKYSWQVELVRAGLQIFQKNKAQFDTLCSGANLALLEKCGGSSWSKIRETKFDGEDLAQGAAQYAKACEELTTLLTNLQAVEKSRAEFHWLSTNGNSAGLLAKLGGADWSRIRDTRFDTEDVAHTVQQYKEACAGINEIMKTMPERGRLWTNEIRSSNAIEYWTLLNNLAKANSELMYYTNHFGAGTDFERWFGSSSGKIKTWQDDIYHKQRYQTDKLEKENKKR